MSKQKYSGRHRRYSGRHRTQSTALGRTRIVGTGLILPTSAAALLVVTATGAHQGRQNVGLASNPALTQSARVQAQEVTVLRAETRDAKVTSGGGLARAVEDRAARDKQRQDFATVAADEARRQAEREAEAARRRVEEAKSIAPDGTFIGADSGLRSSRRWVKPLNGYTLSSGFGMRWGSLHPGQDFAVAVGTPVRAMSSGTVIFAGWQGGYGYKVEIEYWDGTVSWYAHNSSVKVNEGDVVAPGEVVSLSGQTGHSTGPHVHLEIHPSAGNPMPPLPWLAAKGLDM